MTISNEIIEMLEGVPAKQENIIDDVVNGFMDNFADDVKDKIDALDTLDNQIRNKAWGEEAYDLFDSDSKFRAELEKVLIQALKNAKVIK